MECSLKRTQMSVTRYTNINYNFFSNANDILRIVNSSKIVFE